MHDCTNLSPMHWQCAVNKFAMTKKYFHGYAHGKKLSNPVTAHLTNGNYCKFDISNKLNFC